ncbi:M14 metallopeptidase family protein [Acidobacteriota bacterium]
MKHQVYRCAVLCAVFFLFIVPHLEAQKIPPPEQFYGFQMGADGKLAHWDKIVEYFNLLSSRSDRVLVQNLGESTLGNPFLLAIFSSPNNIKNLEKYRQINRKIADPRGLTEQEIEDLVKNGKYVCAISHSLHASEVGATQGVSELAHELVTSNDPTIIKILENTIFLMIPCFNPDGQIMVTDWFNKYKDTEYSNNRLPYLYHVYTGHDNNRDGFQLTQKETRLFAQVIYRDWIPQAYVDHHQMGSSGARFYIPPYVDPIHPNVDPLIWREHQLYGAHMAVALDRAGKSGIESGTNYAGWVQSLFNNTTNYHNIAGMLTESASVGWANPVHVMPDQLGGSRGRPGYFPQNSMPRLWPGGWWRLRDIVEQQLIASKAVLELGARFREAMLRNMIAKAQGNIERGETEPPYGYIIPKDQHDFPTAFRLVKIFQQNGVEVNVLNKPYQIGSQVFAQGSYVFSCAQPLRVFIKSFLEQVNYPDNPWTRDPSDSSPMRPYDLAEFSMSEQMGVDAIPILEPLRNIDMAIVKDKLIAPKGSVVGNGSAFIFGHNSTESFKAVNKCLANGYEVIWIKDGFTQGKTSYPPGEMIVKGKSDLAAFVRTLADELGLNFVSTPDRMPGDFYKLKPLRMGMYKRFAGGNMDEGWTNWLLQDFEFPFESLFNKDVKDPKLVGNYDVIIVPSDSTTRIVDGQSSDSIPPEYRGGIGPEGVNNIREFVRKGGTLITLNGAWEFAQTTFNLPLRNTVEEVPRKEFYCPGSTVKISVDTAHPLGYGMASNAYAVFRGSPSLRVSTGSFQDKITVAARYHKENILQSGWLIGETYLSNRPAVLEFKIEKGKVIVLAFPAQHRAQTHGTFKFLFNAIYYGSAVKGTN